MVKEFMELRRIEASLGEILDKIEHVVVSGIETPVDVGSEVVKLEIPKSCDECPVEQGCMSKSRMGMYCQIVWEKIISYFTKNIVH